MFKIGEFSKLTQVSIRMLRYYDEMNLLKPYSVDNITGYRLYTSSQIPMLNKIIFLRDIGFSVADILSILNVKSEKSLVNSLKIKEYEIKKEIEELEGKLGKIELANKDILEKTIKKPYTVELIVYGFFASMATVYKKKGVFYERKRSKRTIFVFRCPF